MPTYDYECSGCECLVEDVFQRFSEKPLKKCPECGKHKLFRVMSGGLHVSVRNVNTIGQLADQNAKLNKTKIAEAEAKKKEETPQAPKAWYEDSKYGGATSREINKMTSQQQKRYIMEGKK